jgi:hypothetical protein
MPVYSDDSTVLNDEELLRRVPINPAHVVWDNNEKRLRPSSAAFDNDKDGSPMSVSLSTVLAAQGLPQSSALIGLARFSLSCITAKMARDNDQGIQRDPLAENLAHALVFGEKPKKVGRKLAKSARWIVEPTHSEAMSAGIAITV